ncbi:MAG: recombination regulator RecX [Gammaproteobacteria bacterium]|nr:recombination regulator RecX [Gammaproteobacteria bacterium]
MSDAWVAAVALLARREHGAKELSMKLTQKGHDADEIAVAIAECQRLALQSDERFTESILHVRMRQGYGPDRIRAELQQKQVDGEWLKALLQAEPVDWVVQAKQVLQKKYKSLVLGTWHEQQKQKQFLLYRGFSKSTIAEVFEEMVNEQ